MIKFDVLNRWSGNVQFTAEIECSASASVRIKMGLALRWAYKSGADLSDAVLRGADLRDADLRGADLRGADLRGADLSDADIPIIENIDSKILAAIEDGGTLNMGAWHSCETSHCRAGWAITIAGEAGLALEKSVGAAAAGALIYAKSAPTLPVPNFYTTDALALADIKKRAAAEIVAADSAQS